MCVFSVRVKSQNYRMWIPQWAEWVFQPGSCFSAGWSHDTSTVCLCHHHTLCRLGLKTGNNTHTHSETSTRVQTGNTNSVKGQQPEENPSMLLLLLIGYVAPTWTGVESQVRDLGGGPLQLSQHHGAHLEALLVGFLGFGAAPAPQVDATVQEVLGGWRNHKQPHGATQEKKENKKKRQTEQVNGDARDVTAASSSGA